MGTIAVRRAGDAVSDVARILAIQALCVAQAMDLRRRESGLPFSAAAGGLHAAVRSHSAFLDEDRRLSAEIERMVGRFSPDLPRQLSGF